MHSYSIIAIFVPKFQNFHYYGNKAQTGANFNDDNRISDHNFLKRVGYFGSQKLFCVILDMFITWKSLTLSN